MKELYKVFYHRKMYMVWMVKSMAYSRIFYSRYKRRVRRLGPAIEDRNRQLLRMGFSIFGGIHQYENKGHK